MGTYLPRFHFPMPGKSLAATGHPSGSLTADFPILLLVGPQTERQGTFKLASQSSGYSRSAWAGAKAAIYRQAEELDTSVMFARAGALSLHLHEFSSFGLRLVMGDEGEPVLTSTGATPLALNAWTQARIFAGPAPRPVHPQLAVAAGLRPASEPGGAPGWNGPDRRPILEAQALRSDGGTRARTGRRDACRQCAWDGVGIGRWKSASVR